jgi:hypothetical protein
MKIRHVVTAAVATVFASVLALSCGGKKVGGSCSSSESTCVDKKTAIACRGGTFAQVPCAGPGGCSKYKDHANCDTSSAAPGDGCMGEDDEYACTADNKHLLACKGGKFEPYLECRGKTGCSISGRAFSCDATVAEKGDVCKTPSATACSVDGKQLLTCRDGKFALQRYCRGKNGCAPSNEGSSCDETMALVGDPCGVSGQIVCALDGKSELVCQSGAFFQSISCKNGCTVTGRPGHPIDCR